jgi:Protein of unknown function (DUF4231)
MRSSLASREDRRDRRLAKRHADEIALARAAKALTPADPETTALAHPAGSYLMERALPYACFCEDQARGFRLLYYWLRIPAVILATIVAANLGAGARWVATGLGVVVAASTATEHFLNAGGRWRHYRATVEAIKGETWRYLGLVGVYANSDSHATAYRFYVSQVEAKIDSEWSAYIALVDPNTQSRDGNAQPSQATTTETAADK